MPRADVATTAALVQSICGRLPCRVGGGVRSVERAREVLALGAHAVIASSALFRDGVVDAAFARSLAEAVGVERVIAAVDSRGGRVVIHGWKTALPLTAVDAVRALEPFCSEFLYTHVDAEGLMGGTDMQAIMAVRRATSRRVTAAGGITTWEEIDQLDAAGIDSVVGMAIYTGQLTAVVAVGGSGGGGGRWLVVGSRGSTNHQPRSTNRSCVLR